MIRVVASTTGYGAALNRVQNYLQRSTSGLENRAVKAAEFAMEAAIEEMDMSGGGMFWPGNRTESSLPGKYPAIQWGDLIASMDVVTLPSPSDVGRAAWDAGGYGVPQAFYMEFGTSRHAPRPFMRPTVRKYRDHIRQIMGSESTKNRLAMTAVRYY